MPTVACKGGAKCNDPDDCTACVVDGQTCEEQGECGSFVTCTEEGKVCSGADGGTPGSPKCINSCQDAPKPDDQPTCLNGSTWDGKSKCVSTQPCIGDPAQQIKCPFGKAPKADGGDRCGYSCEETAVTDNILGGTLTTDPSGKSTVKCANDLRKLPWCDKPGLSNWACCVSPTASCGENVKAGEVLADTGGAQLERLPICMDKAMEKAKAFRCRLPPGDYQKSCSKATFTENIANGTCTMSTTCKVGKGGAEHPATFTYRADSAAERFLVNDKGGLVDKPPFSCGDVLGSYNQSCVDTATRPDFYKKKCELTSKCKNDAGETVDATYEFEAHKEDELYLANTNGHLIDKVPYKCRAYGDYSKTCSDVKIKPEIKEGKCKVEARCRNNLGKPMTTSYEFDPKVESGVFLHNHNGSLVNLASSGDVFKCDPIGTYKTSGLCRDMVTITKYDMSQPGHMKRHSRCEIQGKCKANASVTSPELDVHFEYPYSKENETYIQNVNGTLRHNPPWTCPTPQVDESTGCKNGTVATNYRTTDKSKECSYNASCKPGMIRHNLSKFYDHTTPPHLVGHLGFVVNETEHSDKTFNLGFRVPCGKTCNHDSRELYDVLEGSNQFRQMKSDAKLGPAGTGVDTKVDVLSVKSIPNASPSDVCHQEDNTIKVFGHRIHTFGTHTVGFVQCEAQIKLSETTYKEA